jgi:hypothetical protein
MRMHLVFWVNRLSILSIESFCFLICFANHSKVMSYFSTKFWIAFLNDVSWFIRIVCTKNSNSTLWWSQLLITCLTTRNNVSCLCLCREKTQWNEMKSFWKWVTQVVSSKSIFFRIIRSKWRRWKDLMTFVIEILKTSECILNITHVSHFIVLRAA